MDALLWSRIGSFLAVLAAAVLLLVIPASAATIRVPADQPTIQAGINAASPGDTVLVAPGTYTGPDNRGIDFGGKELVLRSEAGPELTIIDCENQTSRGFHFHSGESSAAVVDGFTVTNGLALHGGAVLCDSSSPTISNCIFSGNTSLHYGGAISCESDAAPTLSFCAFVENEAAQAGGAIRCLSATVTVSNCTFDRNAAIGGAGLSLMGGASATLENTIITFSTQGNAVECYFSNDPILSCCDIYGNAGGDWIGCIADQYGINGNISEDPLFCDPDLGDFTLHADSPCAPEHSGGCGLIGALPVGCAATSVAVRESPSPWLGLRTYPNPMRADGTIEWATEHLGTIILRLYDPPGRLTLSRDLVSGGSSVQQVRWADMIGRNALSSGVYFLELAGPARERQVARVIVAR